MALLQQDEVVDEKAAEALPADVLSGLVNANWKERLAAMQKFTDVSPESLNLSFCSWGGLLA